MKYCPPALCPVYFPVALLTLSLFVYTLNYCCVLSQTQCRRSEDLELCCLKHLKNPCVSSGYRDTQRQFIKHFWKEGTVGTE